MLDARDDPPESKLFFIYDYDLACIHTLVVAKKNHGNLIF